jgi:hypothetical protein
MKNFLLLSLAIGLFAPVSAAVFMPIEMSMPEAFRNPAFYQCPSQSVFCENEIPNYLVINDDLAGAFLGDFEMAYRFQLQGGGFEGLRVWGVVVTEEYPDVQKALTLPEENGMDFRVRLYDGLDWVLPDAKSGAFPLEFIAEGVLPVVLDEFTSDEFEYPVHFALVQLDIPVPANLLEEVPQEGWVSCLRLNPATWFKKGIIQRIDHFLQAGTFFDDEEFPDLQNPPTLIRQENFNVKSLNESGAAMKLLAPGQEILPAKQADAWTPAPFQASFALTQTPAIPLKSLSIALALVLMAGFAWFRLR